MYRKLEVWRKSYAFGLEIYKSTNSFPKEEMFGITSQIRRAATSIPANIAEGNSRNSIKEFIQFISIARGSAAVVETWLMYSRDLGYISKVKYAELSKMLDDIKALLFGLMRSKSERKH